MALVNLTWESKANTVRTKATEGKPSVIGTLIKFKETNTFTGHKHINKPIAVFYPIASYQVASKLGWLWDDATGFVIEPSYADDEILTLKAQATADAKLTTMQF